MEGDLFPGSLLERPLLKAIQADRKVVLLVDEVDKSDSDFEAFLFEVLSDFQVSIPELGTIRARHIPIVLLTSNSERELSDGLKRRCVFLYLDFPGIEREIEIIKARVPQAGERLTVEIARAVHHIRQNQDIRKKPSIAETLDWARTLVSLNMDRLQGSTIERTLNILLKSRGDQRVFREQIGAMHWKKGQKQPGLTALRNIDGQGVRKINSRQAGKKVPDYLENNLVCFRLSLRSEGVRIGNSEVIGALQACSLSPWKTGRRLKPPSRLR